MGTKPIARKMKAIDNEILLTNRLLWLLILPETRILDIASGMNLVKKIILLIAEYCPRLSVGKNNTIKILSALSVTPNTGPSELLCFVNRKKSLGDFIGLNLLICKILISDYE